MSDISLDPSHHHSFPELSPILSHLIITNFNHFIFPQAQLESKLYELDKFIKCESEEFRKLLAAFEDKEIELAFAELNEHNPVNDKAVSALVAERFELGSRVIQMVQQYVFIKKQATQVGALRL